ncbi:MAG TPA: YfhO family protein [Gemmatimonadaceae bacterium]|nr:YfhO family protein [Gemmatimonadaceae bacterium]
MAQPREKSQGRHHTHTIEQSAAPSIPAPRFALAWAALVYALAVLILGYPALIGQFLVNSHSDQYIAGYAFREFGAQTLRTTGHFPLWNPYLFGGMPYIAAMHGDIFYPTFLLRMIMPTDVAMTWGFIIHIFLAGLFTYIFLRGLGYGFYAALIGGLAYMMSGQIASAVSPGHDGKLFVSALYPLGLFFLQRGIRDGKNWSWGAFALIVGLCVLSPHPQLLQYMLLASGAYGLFLAFATLDGVKLPRNVAIRRLGLALIAVVIGLAIGAVQYLPVREYVRWSPRAGGLPDYMTATSYAWPPEELLNVYLPQFSGMLDNYWGRNIIHLHSDYVGVVILILAGAAFIGWRQDARKKHLYFWLGALVIALLWSLGSTTPFYQIPYAIIPGTKYFRAPATIWFVGTLALSVFAASGTERFLQRRVSQRYLLGWLIFGGAIAVLASVGALSTIAESFADSRLVERAVANRRALFLGAWRSLLFVVVVDVIWYAYNRGKLTARNVALALLIASAVDLWSIERSYWMFSPPAKQLFASDPIIQQIKSDPQPARVVAFSVRGAVARDPFLDGDGLMVHGIRTVMGYHGNQIGRYNDLIGLRGSDNRLFLPNILALTNSRYFLTDIPELPFLGNTARLKGPVVNASGDTTYLFRFNSENPYAWVTPIAVRAPDDQVIVTLLNPRFDVKRAALFDTSAHVATAQNVQALPEPLALTASVRSYAPGKVDIDLSAPAPSGSSLVVSENYYPGWLATVDGKPAKIGRVDYTMIGVELPQGARSVSLQFTSPTYQRGKVITWIAILLGLVMLAGGTWRDRRRLG